MDTRLDCSPVLFCCRACGMRFESGIADPARGGGERCPQCFLEELVALDADEAAAEAFVVRHGTKFR